MVCFRKMNCNDVPFLNEIRNECAELYLHDSRKFSLEDTYNWFSNLNPDYYIIMYNNNRIGYFRLSNYSIVNKNIYLGADLHKEWRGKGLAYEAYCKFIPFIFKTYDLNKITLEVLSNNSVAKNLYKKLGFKSEGIKRQEIYKNGIYIDSEIMSMLKEEFNKNSCI